MALNGEFRGVLEAEARQAHEHDRADDEELALDQLIGQLCTPVEDEGASPEGFVRKDEFVCRSCHLVVHRGVLADRLRMVCSWCAAAVEKVGSR